MVRVACIGECMIELSEHADGSLTRSYGGDTLNTALYMARLGTPVDYVTALGDDGWSDEMLAAWKAEGIGTAKVLRLPGRLPGLYVIQTRYQWRTPFPVLARQCGRARPVRLAETPELVEALARDYSLLYLSGITLSLYGEQGRAVLFEALDKARAARGPHRLRHQFPDARLAGPRAGAAGLPGHPGPCRYRPCLHRGSGPAVRRGRNETFLDEQRPAELVLKLARPACRVMVEGRTNWSKRGRSRTSWTRPPPATASPPLT